MHRVEPSGARGAHLITDTHLGRGELVCRIDNYQIISQPTYRTIQIGPDQHLEDLGVIVYMNHACQPNTIVDTENLAIYAIRDIEPGEDLTFFYPSTEWEMDRPFVCLCGAPGCIRFVAGAKYLSLDVLSRYFINPHIRRMVAAALDQETHPQVRSLVPGLPFPLNGRLPSANGELYA